MPNRFPLLASLAVALAAALLSPAIGAPPLIEGPDRGDPGQEIRLTVAGLEAPDLTKSTLADLAAWLQTLTVTVDRPAGGASSIDAEITLTVGAAAVKPRLTFRADRPGDYVVIVLDGKRPSLEGLATKRLTIGPAPKPEPDPEPDPEPKPNPPPIPAAGFRAMIIYEQGNQLTPQHQAILTGKTVRDYLAANCVKDERGRPAFRIYDQNADLANEDKVWRDAIALPRAGLPWLIVSNGTAGYSGPLPETPEQTVELFARYAGK